MNKITAKIIQVSDLIQWSEKGELELSPKYQRNSVWNETAKAYLIDTIVRGLPIPPIFLRQSVDVDTRKTFREIVDGQQRVRAILEYIVDESFVIKKSHNKEYGGKCYSDLEDAVKEAILQYEIVAEVISEKNETIIYDMFARLNSNNIVLNKQEIRNSKFWGEFKVFVYRMASKFRSMFSQYNILTDNEFARMKDAEFISSLVIIFTEGIKDEKPAYIDEVYAKYDNEFTEAEEIETKLTKVFSIISNIFKYLNGHISCFSNKNYFYSLFAAISYLVFNVAEEDILDDIPHISESSAQKVLTTNIVSFLNDYDRYLTDKENMYGLSDEFSTFIKDHKVRTTSKNERIRRITFLAKQLGKMT